ncbi:MAG: hypothetical protein WCH84_03770 [Verrucomicrobiota bacterium]
MPISLDVDLSWPQTGDKLFISGPDHQNDALLNRGERTLDQYADGYKLGAEALVDRVIETGIMHDFLVLPIAFLYRQYFELRLKEMVDSTYRLAVIGFIPNSETVFWEQWKSEVSERLRNPGLTYPVGTGGHDLQKLWTEVRPLIETVFPTTTGNDLDAVEACLREFQEADQGDGFRYPVTTKGLKTLQGLSRVNLRELKETVHRISALLESVSEGLAINRQAQQEMNEDSHP